MTCNDDDAHVRDAETVLDYDDFHRYRQLHGSSINSDARCFCWHEKPRDVEM